MTDRGGRDQKVDRLSLNAVRSASVPERGRRLVVGSVGLNEWKQSEGNAETLVLSLTPDPLEDFLEDDPEDDNRLPGFDQRSQLENRRVHALPRVTPEGERPDARINEDIQRRLRSAL